MILPLLFFIAFFQAYSFVPFFSNLVLDSYNYKLYGKIRQHVNPLTLMNRQPIKLETNWVAQLYPTAECRSRKQLIIDVGCSKGAFV
jgi:hypothetical protein